VEYSANLLEAKVGLDRERLIMLALFLGCDYCEGVKGVGLVNGMEIISSYEDFESLIRWKEWAMRPDLWLDIGKKDNVYQKAMGEFFLLCSHFCL
jgi:5'-3' exonuclease